MIQPWEKKHDQVRSRKPSWFLISASTPPTTARCIRLVFPELTEDRRKELAKDVKKKGEGAKVAIRNIRRDANDAFKKLKGSDVSEDEIKELEDNDSEAHR